MYKLNHPILLITVLLTLGVVWNRNLVLATLTNEFLFDNKFNEKNTINKSDYLEFFTKSNESYIVYELKYPIPIYETLIRKIAIYKNGFLALDDASVNNLPINYPHFEQITQKRLQDFDGRYLSVYSSVNDEDSGVIRVRELDPYSVNEMNCEEKLQTERLINFTHTYYPDEKTFKPQSILVVSWLNMTKQVDDKQKTNSYSLIVISNGIHSYGFMQYWNIEWNELDDKKHMTLPPEAGIFMRPFGGYQLPRSGQPVDPMLWISESNVALPGEWLIPLHNLINVGEPNVHKLNKIKKQFLILLKQNCESSNSRIDQISSTDTIVLHLLDINTKVNNSGSYSHKYNTSLIDTYDFVTKQPTPKTTWKFMLDEAVTNGIGLPKLEADFEVKKDMSTEPVKEGSITTTTTTTLMPSVFGANDGDSTRQPVWETEVTPQYISPLYSNAPVSDELSVHLLKCDAVTQCTNHNTECYLVQNKPCCICGEGFFGAGDTKCWSEANDHKFAFYGDFINHIESIQYSLSLTTYLDIQHGTLKRSSSGIRGGRANDDLYRTLRLTTPIFHVINSLIASKCDGLASNERIYNPFTLSGGLKEPFNIQFYFEIEQVGRFTIQVGLKLDDISSSGPYTNGQLKFELVNADNLKLVQHDYREAYSGSDNPDQTYYAAYKVDQHGRIIFDRQKVKFVAETQVPDYPQELFVHWTAVADSQSCLLKTNSPVPQNKLYYIRLKDRGYCSEDCASPDGSCHMFCVDEPVILPNEPSACDCVTCDREGEVCKADRFLYHCDCAPGLQRSSDGSCLAIPSVGVTEYLGPQCGAINCHIQGRCINPNEAFCQCLPGYRGDGISHCEIDPCTRCKRNEICENGVCIRSSADLCEGIRCGEQAFCQDGRCVCNPGYTGDPVEKCFEERDHCSNVQCHTNAKCVDGQCQCLNGYIGDGYHSCNTMQDDPCTGVTCHPDARCYNGDCQCLPGYQGDGVRYCYPDRETSIDRCANVRCHSFAQCTDGVCRCVDGYEGDGMYDCRPSQAVPTDRCANMICHPKGECVDGICRCVTGYEGDGVHQCRLSQSVLIEGTVPTQLCAGVQCHPFGQCYENRCYCSHGYVGDGVNFCDARTDDPCDGIRCTENARCQQGRCACNPGYEGDGYHECRYQEDKCANVRCAANAICEAGVCTCAPNFEGDGSRECRLKSDYMCKDNECHQYARCSDGRCRCLQGYEGDGYQVCNPIRPVAQDCGNCRGIPIPELAQCIDGRCVCTEGYIEAQPGLCMECVQDNCHPNAVCRPDERFNGAYACRCKPGFVGDGITLCRPEGTEPERPTVGLNCPSGCHIRNSECDRSTGQCRCRTGYDGDGVTRCEWNCRLCLPNAVCEWENERCVCPVGYHGDGQTYCEMIPLKPSAIQVEIINEGRVMQITDLSRPLELRCLVRTGDRSVMGHWIQPATSQQAVVTTTSVLEGFEILLRINKPSIRDSGKYECKAGTELSTIDVVIEESAIPFTIFLTSDDGILKTTSTNSNLTMATLWNIAENNKYGRVAMATDCNRQRVIYTNEYGHSIRWGDANSEQKLLQTNELINSKFSRFRNLAIDYLSGNVFAWDELNSKITILNPDKPNIRHTLNTIQSLTSSIPQHFAGLTVHPTQGLIYFALFTDGWRPNGTIQVVSMTGENEQQLLQLAGEPMAISLFATAGDTYIESAGRLCWIQRSTKGVYGLVTELHCARLSANGRQVLANEKVKEFMPSQEPSWGMTQYKDTVLWADAMRTVYYSINPERKVRVKHVCCSNRFQAISVMTSCSKVSNNPCSYSNGQCRYICLPNEDRRTRTCVCPDEEPACHREQF